MQKKLLEWSHRAESELLRYASFYTVEVSKPVADRFIESVRKATNLVANNPLLYRTGKKAGTREYVMQKFPFTIVYRVKSSRVEIIRVLHQASRYFN